MYDQSSITDPDTEWSLRGVSEGWLDNVVGIRVKGTSLEPVARDGQMILIRKHNIKNNITNDMLACVSTNNDGDVIKRCYIKGPQCVLCAINPNEREGPMIVDLESIHQAYELRGVLFEVGIGKSTD